MSAYDLLIPTSVLLVPVLSYAALIDQQWGSCLRPPDPGVYKVNGLEPIIIPGKHYFYRARQSDGTYPLVPITNFDAVETDVYDEFGRVVVHGNMMLHKQTCLLPEPNLPVRALKIIELLINSHLSTVLKHIHRNVYASSVALQLKEGFEYLETEGYLEQTCSSLFKQIDEFIGRDVWHIYFVKLNMIEIRIEKTIDHRIFEWEQNHGVPA